MPMIAVDAANEPITTRHGYTIRTIGVWETSPFENHLYGEIAADEDAREFWVHHVLVNHNGMDSILEACNRYQPTTH